MADQTTQELRNIKRQLEKLNDILEESNRQNQRMINLYEFVINNSIHKEKTNEKFINEAE